MADSVQDLSAKFDKLSTRFDSFQEMMKESLDKWSGLEAWRMTADEALGELLQKTTTVAEQVDSAAARITTLEFRPPPQPEAPPRPHLGAHPSPGLHPRPPAGAAGIELNMAPHPSPRSPMGDDNLPSGHHQSYGNRVLGGGILGPPPRPVTGMPSGSPSFVSDSDSHSAHRPPFPKLEFPKFSGDQPRLWRDHCLMYFEVYDVHPALKTRFAALNFTGAAALWLQSVERRGRISDWELLCKMVFEKFDRDQYPLLLKQFSGLRQTGTVAEFIEEFERMAHGILLYNPGYDDTYFVTQFMAGLREDIRSMIILHRPKDVATASALALLQEEELSIGRQKSSPREIQKHVQKAGTDRWRVGDSEKSKGVLNKQEGEDKLASLKDHRRKNGLCFKCGEKWSQHHTCPAKVSLHVIEELWDALTPTEDMMEFAEVEVTEDVITAVSSEAGGAPRRRRTLKLCGKIGKHEILVLVDSRSVGTFVSECLVSQLGLQTVPTTPVQFVAADGSPMICAYRVPQLMWTTQKHTFTSNAGVIPLKCFDMVLGQDWLEECSPMWVDWVKKILRFTVKGQRITLFGIKSRTPSCTAVCSVQLQGLIRRGAIDQCLQFKATMPESQQQGQTVHSIAVPDKNQWPKEVQQLLTQYEDVFRESHELPPQRPFDHHIDLLPGAPPVNVRPYRYSPAQKSEIEKQLAQMLEDGIIKPSSSPYASPVLLVRKKDGSWRFCVDYRHLNAQTIKNKHPMPVVDELIDELGGACWFSKLDFRAGYHQIRIEPADTHKTAFKTHDGLYEFLVMPFGLTNAPATFQSVMNMVFRQLLRRGVLVFMDDILIYSASLKEHLVLLQEVLEILRTNQFFIKLSKCSFAQHEVEYLGHIISDKGVATEPSKILAVQNWPTPTNLKQLRGFLGLTGYYRKFIKGYGLISKPLTELLKKATPFVWTSVTEATYQHLKQALVTAPVLAIPDFSKEFVVETDASELGFGAVLMQGDHPVAYLSKPVCRKNQALSTYEKECMAIIFAVDKWRPYLQHRQFIIRTDHQSLLHLTQQRVSSKLQHKALMKLMDLDFKIVFKQGCSNKAADALSRCYSENIVLAVSSCNPVWLQRVTQGYADDPEAQSLLAELAINPENSKGYTLVDGVIRFRGRIWLGKNRLAQEHVMKALHDSAVGGHSGSLATYHRIRALFAWPGMRQQIQGFVQRCQVCQQAKVEHVRTPGMLQPLPVPEQAWQVVCLDFIEGLPKSSRFDTIMVVIDKFTKYGHFIPLAHPFTALQVAQKFLDEVYRLHGLPQSCDGSGPYIHQCTLAGAVSVDGHSAVDEFVVSSSDGRTDGAIEPVFRDISSLHSQCMSTAMEQVAVGCRILVQYLVPFCTWAFSLRGSVWTYTEAVGSH